MTSSMSSVIEVATTSEEDEVLLADSELETFELDSVLEMLELLCSVLVLALFS